MKTEHLPGLSIGFILILFACVLLYRVAVDAATAPAADPSIAVVEQDVTLAAGSDPTQLVPTGAIGYLIQPQTSGYSIRVGFTSDTDVSTSKGVVINYLEALAEQPIPGRRFHAVHGVASTSNVTVRVVYYR